MLFYVLQGTSEFTIENRKYRMDTQDFLVVNADERYSFLAKGNFLAASFIMPYSEISSLLKKNTIYFRCNSVMENNELYNEIRSMLQQIVSTQSSDNINEIYFNSLYYSLMNILTQNFMVGMDDSEMEKQEHKFDDRKRAITEYIRSNYNKDISLNDLANKLYLSNAYLSKYIKRQFGMSFLEYVNSVRLNYAVSQLLHSDQSVVHIAMETGFASSAALSKAFREKYQMTPTDYRRNWKEQREKDLVALDEDKIIKERVSRLIQANESQVLRSQKRYDRQVILKSNSFTPVPACWNEMINVGAASDLLKADVQKQVLYLKDHLHFKYVRFWDIYSSEMLLDNRMQGEKYNFDHLDAVLDFLVQNGLKPYVELRSKPKKLVLNVDNTIAIGNENDVFENRANAERFFTAFIVHLMNRFSSAEVESWYFELWKTEREEYFHVTEIEDIAESIELYLDMFEWGASLLKKYLPNIRIGGGGFSLRYGEQSFRDLLNKWKEKKNLPDFISVYCYPYTTDSITMNRNQTMNSNYLYDTIMDIRRIMEETSFPVRALHVTEWNFSVSNRNVLNDHCMKGAYILKNLWDSMAYVDMIGYWNATDLFSDYYDSYKMLNGASGLLSKYGIPKPAYFAYEFMSSLGRYLQQRGENYIITSNGNENYRLACHNLKALNYQYGQIQEDKITLEQQESMFEDLKTLRLDFDLPVQKDGKYKLQIRRLNRKHGSIQDEWMQMESPERLSFTDLEYLSRITTPQMRIREVETVNKRIHFQVELEANEIMFIHAIYLYA